jgi:hypothetical protein
MTKHEFKQIFDKQPVLNRVGLFLLRQFVLSCAGRFVMALAMLAAFALSGCSSIPSVQACKIFKYERDGQEWSLEAKECRVMQAPIPVGL